jgi:hypothetical protein
MCGARIGIRDARRDIVSSFMSSREARRDMREEVMSSRVTAPLRTG